MKLYIAASSHPDERARVDAAFAGVADFATVVGDWRQDCDKYGANPSGIDCAPFALADLEAVVKSQLLWLLMPQTETRGAWVEFGAAWSLGKLLICSGPGQDRSIFTSLATFQSKTDADAVELLREIAASQLGQALEEGPCPLAVTPTHPAST
jgi:hypothetical protein